MISSTKEDNTQEKTADDVALKTGNVPYLLRLASSDKIEQV